MHKYLLFALTLSSPLLAYALTDTETTHLVQQALIGRERAYAPYSNYHVGAAVRTRSGKVYLGCNVENASYGVANCAERTAVFKAVSENDREIVAVAVITQDGGMPCGACRQVLNEFNPKMEVIAADPSGKIHYHDTLDHLLPHAFGPANLQK